jgi:hypothetical protein
MPQASRSRPVGLITHQEHHQFTGWATPELGGLPRTLAKIEAELSTATRLAQAASRVDPWATHGSVTARLKVWCCGGIAP